MSEIFMNCLDNRFVQKMFDVTVVVFSSSGSKRAITLKIRKNLKCNYIEKSHWVKQV